MLGDVDAQWPGTSGLIVPTGYESEVEGLTEAKTGKQPAYTHDFGAFVIQYLHRSAYRYKHPFNCQIAKLPQSTNAVASRLGFFISWFVVNSPMSSGRPSDLLSSVEELTIPGGEVSTRNLWSRMMSITLRELHSRASTLKFRKPDRL
jgi:hypothetical protein